MILDIAFNLPDANNLSLKGAAHHGRAVEQFYTPEEIEQFVSVGDPKTLHYLLIPLAVAQTNIVAPIANQ